MIKNVLITGGAGFIGSYTTDLLISKNYNVVVLDSLHSKTHNNNWPEYINPQAEYIKGDVLDRNLLDSLLSKTDAVIHLAAEMDLNPDFQKFIDINVGSTALIYELIVKNNYPIKKVVLASTQFVYGEGKWECNSHGQFIPKNRNFEEMSNKIWDIRCPVCNSIANYLYNVESFCNPSNHYALSKYFQETLGINLGKLYKIPTVALRYSIVHGPRQSLKNTYSGALRTFVLNLLQSKSLATFEDNMTKRDFVSVFDVANANLLSLESSKANYEIFNVGGGKEYTLYELANMIAKKLNKELVFSKNIEYRVGDIRYAISDISKIYEFLDWKPMYSENETLDLYLNWINLQKINFEDFNNTQLLIRNLGIIKSINYDNQQDSIQS